MTFLLTLISCSTLAPPETPDVADSAPLADISLAPPAPWVWFDTTGAIDLASLALVEGRATFHTLAPGLDSAPLTNAAKLTTDLACGAGGHLVLAVEDGALTDVISDSVALRRNAWSFAERFAEISIGHVRIADTRTAVLELDIPAGSVEDTCSAS